MLTFTTPVNVPNLTKLRVNRVRFDQDTTTAFVDAEVGTAAGGGRIYGSFSLAIRNGLCDTLARTAAPAAWNDLYGLGPQVTLATGFTDFLAAYTGATIAAKNKNAETWMADPTRALFEPGAVT